MLSNIIAIMNVDYRVCAKLSLVNEKYKLIKIIENDNCHFTFIPKWLYFNKKNENWFG